MKTFNHEHLHPFAPKKEEPADLAGSKPKIWGLAAEKPPYLVILQGLEPRTS